MSEQTNPLENASDSQTITDNKSVTDTIIDSITDIQEEVVSHDARLYDLLDGLQKLGYLANASHSVMAKYFREANLTFNNVRYEECLFNIVNSANKLKFTVLGNKGIIEQASETVKKYYTDPVTYNTPKESIIDTIKDMTALCGEIENNLVFTIDRYKASKVIVVDLYAIKGGINLLTLSIQ